MFVNYVSTEEAIELLKKSKGKKVLVAIRDLECDEPIFTPRFKQECTKMISEARTISAACDDFVKTLSLFSETQLDLKNFKNAESEKIILLR